tara:strand:- start:9656 stop:10783 length:1128 start_codon:yes stop_codon:yes gene_type:complete
MHKENLRMQRLAGLITESQYNNKVKEQEALEEGWQSGILGAALLLVTTLSSAQTSKEEKVFDNKEKLEQIKETLEDEGNIEALAEKLKIDPEELRVKMEENADKIEGVFDSYAKKKNLSLTLNIPTGGSSKAYKGKILNGGFAVTGIEIIYDTLEASPGLPIFISDTISLDISQDESQKTFEHKISDEKINSIQNLLQDIDSIGGKIVGIKIISKTDAERVPSYISESDPTGNLTLAKKRAQEAVIAIQNSGIDFGEADFTIDDTSYINGGDSPAVSHNEFRKYSNDDGEIEKLREKSSDERGVEIIIDWEYDSSTEIEVEPEVIVNKIIKVTLAKANVIKSTGSYKSTIKNKKTTKNKKCKIKIGSKTIGCPEF